MSNPCCCRCPIPVVVGQRTCVYDRVRQIAWNLGLLIVATSDRNEDDDGDKCHNVMSHLLSPSEANVQAKRGGLVASGGARSAERT